MSPAGRLVQTLLPESFQHELSIFDMNMRPGVSQFPRPDGAGCVPGTKQAPCSAGTNNGMCTPDVHCENGSNPGRTHRFYSGKTKPAAAFGFGLSYTQFAYSPPQSSAAKVDLGGLRRVLEDSARKNHAFVSQRVLAALAPLVSYTVNVTNTGKVHSDDVVLGFVVPPGAGVAGVPLQSLFGFERVHVRAGETVTVNLYPEMTEFSQVGTDGKRRALPGRYTVRFGVRETVAGGGGFAEHVIVAE